MLWSITYGVLKVSIKQTILIEFADEIVHLKDDDDVDAR